MLTKLLSLNPCHMALAIFTWIFIMAALLTLSSCSIVRQSKNAGCRNGYIGYGEKVHVMKGHIR